MFLYDFVSRIILVSFLLILVTSSNASAAAALRHPGTVFASNLTWSQVPGLASGIAAAPDGSLWAISTLPAGQVDKHIMHLTGKTWTAVSGYAYRIAMAPDGAPYVLSSRGGIYSYRNSTWTPVNNSLMPASGACPGADEGVYFLSSKQVVNGNSTIWRKSWIGRTSQLPGSGSVVGASFDTSTYAVPGVGTLDPYGYFVLTSSGAISYYSQDGSRHVQFPGSASAISPVPGGYFALGYPQTPSGESVYYFDYATGKVTQEGGQYVSLSAYAGGSSQPHLFALDSRNQIWEATINLAPQSVEITEYPLPISPQPYISAFGISPGPDGAMWFAAAGAGVQAIGRITSAGAISEFKTPPSVTSLNGGITEGSDGALWFTHDGNVGRLTTEGKFSDYVVSSSKRTEQITSGPDGSLWFTEIPYLVIGRLSTSGSLSEFSLLDGSGQLNGITSGPDGALWFTVTDTDNSAEYIGRLSTSGSATFYRLDTTGSIDPLEIVAGPNSALYFGQGAESQGIGKITTTGSFQEFHCRVLLRLTLLSGRMVTCGSPTAGSSGAFLRAVALKRYSQLHRTTA
jgi:virginiamycin B lyase